jgi:RNA polymerase sigma-70 factor (ECF subfamily)
MPPRTNDQWLSDLRDQGPAREAALADLRAQVLAGLPRALSPFLSPGDPRFEALTEETAQETLLRVLAKLDTFEGRSQFSTWVYKIAVRIALSELRRQKWKDVSLDELLEQKDDPEAYAEASSEGAAGVRVPPGLEADPAAGPERAAERADLLRTVDRIILEELTDKQRKALVAAGVRGMPLEEVARRMGMQRNALYKLLHDGRLRLKRRLEREGLSVGELLALFEDGK